MRIWAAVILIFLIMGCNFGDHNPDIRKTPLNVLVKEGSTGWGAVVFLELEDFESFVVLDNNLIGLTGFPYNPIVEYNGLKKYRFFSCSSNDTTELVIGSDKKGIAQVNSLFLSSYANSTFPDVEYQLIKFHIGIGDSLGSDESSGLHGFDKLLYDYLDSLAFEGVKPQIK